MENGIIELKNKKFIKIIKIIPINYNLKSDLEKKAILNSYKIFLKTCNFDIQILIQSKKADLSGHIKNLKKISEKENNKILKNYLEKYLEFIQEKNNKNKSATKNTYLIIKNNRNLFYYFLLRLYEYYSLFLIKFSLNSSPVLFVLFLSIF